jgi:excisionase family DNA binding protein
MSDARTYQLVSGETLEYATPPPQVEDYLAQVRSAAQDPDVALGELVDLIYSSENPLLDSGVIPGRGVVTREAYDHPVFQIMLDQISIKRIQLGQLDIERDSERFSMSASEAAEQLGVSVSAIRQAIYSDKLAAQKKGGEWRIDPASVDAYEVSNRGPAKPLEVVMGGIPGYSLSVKCDGELVRTASGPDGETVGEFRRWSSASIKSVDKSRDTVLFWELVPGPAENEIENGRLYVRGRFKVRRKVNDKDAALEAFSRFHA